MASGERTVMVDGLPEGGWHEPGGPVFGRDGLMYFGQGSVSQNGVGLAGWLLATAVIAGITRRLARS